MQKAAALTKAVVLRLVPLTVLFTSLHSSFTSCFNQGQVATLLSGNVDWQVVSSLLAFGICFSVDWSPAGNTDLNLCVGGTGQEHSITNKKKLKLTQNKLGLFWVNSTLIQTSK